MVNDKLIQEIGALADNYREDNDLTQGYLRALSHCTKIIRQHQAEQEVLRVRGSYDAPGFDACVAAEVERLKQSDSNLIDFENAKIRIEQPGDVVERVRLALCRELGVNPVTHSYEYMAKAAIAAMQQNSTGTESAQPELTGEAHGRMSVGSLTGDASARKDEECVGATTSETLNQKTAFEQLYKDAVGTKPMYTDPEHTGVIESDWFHKGIQYAQETLQQREITGNDEFQVSQSELEFALWHSVHWGFAPKHKEECYIKGKVFPPLKAVYDAEYAVFHVGDGEIHLSEVQWQSVFPEPTIERAARNFFKLMNNSPKREYGKQPIETAPKGIPVIVAGGVAMQKTGGEWFTGMEDPRYERPLQWQPKWWMSIPTDNEIEGQQP